MDTSWDRLTVEITYRWKMSAARGVPQDVPMQRCVHPLLDGKQVYSPPTIPLKTR